MGEGYIEGKYEVFKDGNEVQAWTFVLKPDTDYHARVALAAYAASCRRDDPDLASFLNEVLSDDSFTLITWR